MKMVIIYKQSIYVTSGLYMGFGHICHIRASNGAIK